MSIEVEVEVEVVRYQRIGEEYRVREFPLVITGVYYTYIHTDRLII